MNIWRERQVMARSEKKRRGLAAATLVLFVMAGCAPSYYRSRQFSDLTTGNTCSPVYKTSRGYHR